MLKLAVLRHEFHADVQFLVTYACCCMALHIYLPIFCLERQKILASHLQVVYCLTRTTRCWYGPHGFTALHCTGVGAIFILWSWCASMMYASAYIAISGCRITTHILPFLDCFAKSPLSSCTITKEHAQGLAQLDGANYITNKQKNKTTTSCFY